MASYHNQFLQTVRDLLAENGVDHWEDVQSADGLYLQKEIHDKVVEGIKQRMNHVPETVGMEPGGGDYETCEGGFAGFRFALDPEEPDSFVWIEYDVS